jgi:Acyl-coenzyme A:6-aminopenicillanic acid acyl-transferase
MKKRSKIFYGLGLVLCFSLIMFQIFGCAEEAWKGGPAPSAAVPVASTPQPYVTTGFPQVVVVSGTNYEMGVEYGEQAGAAIAHNVAMFKSRLYDKFGTETVTKDMQVWDYYLGKYDPVYKDWLRGIVDGCKQKGYDVSYLDLVMLMVYPTEFWARPKAPYPAETRIASVEAPLAAASAGAYHACTTFAAAGTKTKDGKPIHAITSMSPTETMDNVILLAFPTEGASFVSQTYAGRVNGNSAMNSKGFSWTMTAIMSNTPVWGMPPEVYFHYLAQMTASLDEALAYLKSTPKGGVTGGFILTDASGKISVYEGTADKFHLRHPGDSGESGQFVVETNHLVDPSLSAYNPPWLPAIGTYARYDTAFQLLKEAAPGAVDFTFCKNLYASDDWYDAGKGTWHRNVPGVREVSNSHTSVSQSIFSPADLTAYLETGTPSGLGLPAYATGEYVKIKLATDQKKVTYQADADALALYWDARDSFEHDLNAKAAYLTPTIVNDIRGKLDQAFAAYSVGMDRISFAILATDPKKQAGLWGEAMTNYAAAQLYAQMAKTALLKARTGTP